MREWKHKIAIRHLLTEKEDYKSVQESMNKIADVLQKEPCFMKFSIKKFREIPKGDDIMKPVDYANKLLDRMWDYADDNDIWIVF